jgi:dTDP-4-dehydrorhamnose reductase
VRILILGGDGMLGHQLLKSLAPRHDVRVTLRHELPVYAALGMFNGGNAYGGIDVRSLDRITEVLANFRPHAVINAVGIVKQRSIARESIPSLEINALFPHRLNLLCNAVGARMVHMSTDCVFSGRKGNYRENDVSDAEDLYGRSKFLGEVHDAPCLTLRTSIIGRELFRKIGLLEWFLVQKGTVKGFRRVIYTGFTTLEMARIIERMLIHYPQAYGVYQVSSDPITKYDLLLLFREKLAHAVEIEPDEVYSYDRSLDSTRFRKEFDYSPPSWAMMIEELNSEKSF